MKATLDSWIALGSLKGATAAVVTASGTWVGAAGVDGAGRPLVPDAAQWIASITKTFTAAEVMHLVGKGLVDLDKPLTDYVAVPFDTKGATVRQALAMRTGFPDYPIAPYQRTISKDLGRDWTPAQMLATLPQGTAPLGSLGGTPAYNSINYVLLGQLISNVTHQSYAQALRSDLLDPAGLHRTWVQTAETPAAPLSVGRSTAGAVLVDPAGHYLPSRAVASFTGAGGGMAGDAADVARWGYLLYGGRVLDPALVSRMEADPQPEPTIGPYALGTLVLTDDDGTLMLGHGGGGTDWPYTTVLTVWAGPTPVSVAVLAPEPADFGTQFYDLVVGLERDLSVR